MVPSQAIPFDARVLQQAQEPFEPDEWLWTVHGTRVTLGEYFKWIYYSKLWKP